MTNLSVIRENIQAIRDESPDSPMVLDHISAIETCVDLMQEELKYLRQCKDIRENALTVSEYCRKYHKQDCCKCEDADCCDNTNPSIVNLKTELDKRKRMAVILYYALMKEVGEGNVKSCVEDATQKYDLQKAFEDIEGLLEVVNDV